MMRDQPKLFFIRGYMKSGTNWVANLINLHPRARCCASEFHFQHLRTEVDRIADDSHLLEPGGDPAECLVAFERFVSEIMRAMLGDGYQWLGDKTPQPVLPLTCRGAHYMVITRDPRDVLVSRAYHFLNNPDLLPDFARSNAMRGHLAAFERNPMHFHENPHCLLIDERFVRQTFERWLYFKEIELEAGRLIVGGDLDARLLSLRYEDLHADIDAGRAGIYRFLGLDPEEASPLDARTRPGFETEDPRAFYRRGVIGDWRRYGTPALDRILAETLGGRLRAFGYE